MLVQGKSKVKLVDYPKPMGKNKRIERRINVIFVVSLAAARPLTVAPVTHRSCMLLLMFPLSLTVTDPGDAIIRVTTNTVCGSDLHLFFNEVPGFDVMHKDDIMGHEAVGIVESVGPDVKNLKVGQRVTIAFPIACGNCQFCREQKFTCCDQTNPSSEQELVQGQRLSAMFGYSAMTGGLSGCQSEYVRVPIADLNCLPLPDTVSDDKAIMLSDILVTAFHATEVCHVSKGDSVVVMGAGPVGQLCAMWAKQRGASYVLLVDQHQARLDVAKRALGKHRSMQLCML